MDINKVNLNKIWNDQKADKNNVDELFNKIVMFKNSKRKKRIFTSLILLLTFLIIVGIWFLFHPNFVSSKVGFLLIITAIIFFIINLNKDLFKLSNNFKNENMSSKEYLIYLKSLKEKQLKIQTRVLNSYFLLLYTGVFLFMFEFSFQMSFLWSMIAYIITSIWLLIVWFYIRPRIIKKQNAQIENMINRLHVIQTQFNSEKEII